MGQASRDDTGTELSGPALDAVLRHAMTVLYIMIKRRTVSNNGSDWFSGRQEQDPGSRVCCKRRLNNYAVDNFQSVYKAGHSCENILLNV